MDPTPPRAARQPAPAGGVGRVFRYLYRFPLLLLHIVLLLPPTLLCLAPPLRAIGWPRPWMTTSWPARRC